MKTTGSIFLITVLLLALAAATGAQPMEKRHQLEVRFGMWNQTTDDRTEIAGSVTTSVDNNGLLGTITACLAVLPTGTG